MAVPGRKAPRVVSDRNYENVVLKCQPCFRDSTIVNPTFYCRDCNEHLCSQCAKHHKKAKPSQNHVLLEKDQMPITQGLPSESIESITIDGKTALCPKHKKESIKFYCVDHKSLFCSACYHQEHKLCNVEYIPDRSANILGSAEYIRAIKRIANIQSKCKEVKAKSKENIDISNESLSESLFRLDNFKDETIKQVNELHAKTRNLIETFHESENKKMQSTIATADAISSKSSQTHDTMLELNTKRMAEKLYMKLKESQSQIDQDESRIEQFLSVKDFEEFLFIPNNNINSAIENEKTFGHLTQGSRTIPFSDGTIQHGNDQVLFVDKILVNTSKDEDDPEVTGIAFLSSNKIAVVDNSNNSVKIIDTKKKHTVSEIAFTSSPFDIAKVGRNELVVSLPEEESITFFSTSFLFSTKKIVSVDGNCHGICCEQKKLVLTYVHPPKLEILDLKGKVLKKVSTDRNGDDIFVAPKYVTSNAENIFVSDESRDEVIKLNWEGELIGRFKELDEPKGLTISAKGEIYVCTEDADIFSIANDMSSGHILMKNSKSPQAIATNANGSRMYVSFDCILEESNYIKMFYILNEIKDQKKPPITNYK